ncbi:hypothetical protein P22_0271 [Propionispora sp. 2/2-37]|uniref:YicC/YloC family endoribonuclease n=1 Tax=Propionispora sp. 2/2-37 TaxID=1677858 RepID=UPI0006BB7C18|nr:YicC/YloC family endoribonuclease [Propionispora sp. 2/2-37]CUH94205.1 hypothetical protein P22_0271 [Propionispora sp. 2/2-37]
MLKSMTGFGRGEYWDNDHRMIVEIKAVNHRYNEIVIRMPKNLNALEDKIRRQISKSLVRGRIDVFINMEEYVKKNRVVRVDKELAIAYHNALKELADLFGGDTGSQYENIYQIARYPEVIQVEEFMEDAAALWPKLSQAIDVATENLMLMRSTEGANIQKDLLVRIDTLSSHILAIEERAPQIVSEYREKMLGRMREVLASLHVELDESRLLQETAIVADRINFTEELVRLQSHLAQIKTAVYAEAAVGRKLDFIVQEINRETNTIASKANDFYVANIVVELKSEIEKIREQIQNIE